jgi:hypothetical protein
LGQDLARAASRSKCAYSELSTPPISASRASSPDNRSRRSGHHGFEALRLRHRLAADVEDVHDGGEAHERRVVLQTEAGQQRFKGHAVPDVREGRAVEIESQRALRTVRRPNQPLEARVAIDKAADQPCTGHAIDPQAPPRGPEPPLVLAAIEARNLAAGLVRLIRCQQLPGALAEVRPCRLGFLARFAGEEIDGTYGLIFALQFALQTHQFSGRQRPQGAVRFLPRLAQFGVVLGPVEQLAVGGRFAGGARRNAHQPRAAAFADALVGQRLQVLLAIGWDRKQIGAVA